mmetsp:Transcript_64855/g.140205  ORF Transcript_64855/g.140205 Transcript_64855/m.140205 type:complete len:208 (-) Transcript_64855:7-630(-)
MGAPRAGGHGPAAGVLRQVLRAPEVGAPESPALRLRDGAEAGLPDAAGEGADAALPGRGRLPPRDESHGPRLALRAHGPRGLGDGPAHRHPQAALLDRSHCAGGHGAGGHAEEVQALLAQRPQAAALRRLQGGQQLPLRLRPLGAEPPQVPPRRGERRLGRGPEVRRPPLHPWRQPARGRERGGQPRGLHELPGPHDDARLREELQR